MQAGPYDSRAPSVCYVVILTASRHAKVVLFSNLDIHRQEGTIVQGFRLWLLLSSYLLCLYLMCYCKIIVDIVVRANRHKTVHSKVTLSNCKNTTLTPYLQPARVAVSSWRRSCTNEKHKYPCQTQSTLVLTQWCPAHVSRPALQRPRTGLHQTRPLPIHLVYPSRT